jgi:hypothetical protein
MKSIQILRAHYINQPEKERYSELLVLRSGSAYYLGTFYTGTDGFVEPGSRDTSYVETKSQAELALRVLNQLCNDMKGQMEETIIENWEVTMMSRHNLEIFYRYNP